ncbi:hypothetical protein WHR41_07303 [Cladosporium halotolerans]|uniref:Uncharacterized protein n=1 Tax=Cladosporium halotolerans TaxID=1052096 RepID=A0AB34KGP1_9PEZI
MKLTTFTLIFGASLSTIGNAAPVDRKPEAAEVSVRDPAEYSDYGSYPPLAGGYGEYSNYGTYPRDADPEPQPEALEARAGYGKYNPYSKYGKYGKYGNYGSYKRETEAEAGPEAA